MSLVERAGHRFIYPANNNGLLTIVNVIVIAIVIVIVSHYRLDVAVNGADAAGRRPILNSPPSDRLISQQRPGGDRSAASDLAGSIFDLNRSAANARLGRCPVGGRAATAQAPSVFWAASEK